MLTTGSRNLDELLGGGIEEGVLTQVYGPFASGKTTLALQVGLLSGGKVAYVDTEGGFSPERLAGMAENRGFDVEEALSRFLLFEPMSFSEQRRGVGRLKRVVDEHFSLVVVDSISAHYRVEEHRGDMLQDIARQLQVLWWLARRLNIAVMVINQVHFDPKGNAPRPIAETTLGYRCKDILRLEKHPKPSVRIAVLERHRFMAEGRMAYFRLSDAGIEDI
ncbi:DNA repair and recombination protein RadB [Palaeococcus ferrophilus]|uniref:DNA repair and recombination protein RadB n=1 Tax=Palaeococcus ferrophilus TaxID=83868 RepID=UPI00064F4EE3|nr:DNA repair and recombination protein RadB [Palaeococcus ferrophilus]